MPICNLPQHREEGNKQRPATKFRRPDNCSVAVCSAIELYEQELERHRATEYKLRETVLREGDLLRQRNEIILQKEILAKETEHRLLNGLQMIKSVLSIQSRGATSPEVAAQLTMAANRVATLARIHQHLHTLDNLETVDFKQFLAKLCSDLSDMIPSESAERSICVEGADLQIPRVTATPLGYIASELITNSVKYAKGKIAVGLHTLPNGGVVLSVLDDGPGLPESFDPAATSGLGMKIIATLVKQIHGQLTISKGDKGHGTRFSVIFNLES